MSKHFSVDSIMTSAKNISRKKTKAMEVFRKAWYSKNLTKRNRLNQTFKIIFQKSIGDISPF